MKKKLLFLYLALSLLSVGITIGISWWTLEKNFYEKAENEILLQAKIFQRILPTSWNSGDEAQLFVNQFLSKNLRITIIEESGKVIADNFASPIEMSNHFYRPEITALRRGEKNFVMRYSATLKAHYYYYAFVVRNGLGGSYYARLAIPVEHLKKETWQVMESILVAMAFGLILGLLIWSKVLGKQELAMFHLLKSTKDAATGIRTEKIIVEGDAQIKSLAHEINAVILNKNENDFLLEKKNAELEAILKSMSSGLIALNDQYQIVIYNEAILHLLGVRGGNFLNQPFYRLLRNTELFEVMERVIERRQEVKEEMKLELRADSKILKLTGIPMVSADNKFLGGLLIAEDVTKIRRLENMRRDFVSNVSHELKTPLTAIKGFVSELKAVAKDDIAVRDRFLDIIEIEADRLTTLIEEILMLSDIENMKRDRNIHEFSLVSAAEEVKSTLEPHWKKKNLEFVTEYQDNLPFFSGNYDRIKQLLINLVDNAIKYTAEGKITLRISYQFSHYVIEVEDTGIGIAPEHLPHLFERFYRVDKGRSRSLGGTGLGLSVAKHIAELYQGNIRVDSEIGKGTKMLVRFPDLEGV